MFDLANVVKTVILLRRGTTAEWLQYKDVVPAAGEPCYDLEQHTLKIGDGVLSYEKLPVIGGIDVKVEADGKSVVVDNDVFKLMGFDAAEVGAQPRKNANGELEWVVPSTETVDGLKDAVAGLQSDVTTISGNVANLQTELKTIQEIVNPSGEGEVPLLSRVETLEYKMDGTGEGTVDAKIEAKIKAFEEKVTDNGTIDTIQELIKYVADHGGEAQAMVNDIAALKNLVGETPVKDQIDNAVSGKVDKVDGMGLSSNDFTDSLLAKLEAIEEAAQVNVIEKVSVGGSILDVVDKIVEIPVAGTEKAGVVKSATGANMVNVAEDGTMSVKKISTRSLFTPIGDELILDGGSADKSAPVYSVRIGNMGCNSISDAVAAADNGDVVVMQENINMGTGDNDHLVVNAENVTINFDGKELVANGSNGAIKAEGGVVTLEGAGTVNSTLGPDNYSMAVWCAGENAKVVINDGTYCNSTDNSERGTDLIYASAGGNIEINGGTFIAAKPEWTLNVKDIDYKSGASNIIVRGGRFYKFNPADCNSEGQHTSFVAEGYKSVQDGDYYVVKPI